MATFHSKYKVIHLKPWWGFTSILGLKLNDLQVNLMISSPNLDWSSNSGNKLHPERNNVGPYIGSKVEVNHIPSVSPLISENNPCCYHDKPYPKHWKLKMKQRGTAGTC